MAAVLREQGKYDEAIERLQRALLIKQERYPSRHLDIAATLNNIGLIYANKKDYDRAIECHQKSLWMKEGLPPSHPSLGTTYGHLAEAYEQQDRHQLALEYRLKHLLNCQKNLPVNHPSIADSLNHVGDIYQHLHQPNMALEYYKQALAIYKKTLPTGDSDRQKAEENIQQLDHRKCSIQ